MAGLVLNGRVGVGSNYTPLLPASAAASTSNAGSIGQQAYGVNGTGANTTKATAGYGAVGVGIAAIAIMAYLWWSLPR